jgi:hypothetical protein
MSHVTDIIVISLDAEEDADGNDIYPRMDQLNKWIDDWLFNRYGERFPPQLLPVHQHAGGGKHMQCNVFMAAINGFDIPGFVKAFRAIPWDSPECAQLLVKDEHDDRFTIYLPNGAPNKVFAVYTGEYEMRDVHSVHGDQAKAEQVWRTLHYADTEEHRQSKPDVEAYEVDPELCLECGHHKELHVARPEIFTHSFVATDDMEEPHE